MYASCCMDLQVPFTGTNQLGSKTMDLLICPRPPHKFSSYPPFCSGTQGGSSGFAVGDMFQAESLMSLRYSHSMRCSSSPEAQTDGARLTMRHAGRTSTPNWIPGASRSHVSVPMTAGLISARRTPPAASFLVFFSRHQRLPAIRAPRRTAFHTNPPRTGFRHRLTSPRISTSWLTAYPLASRSPRTTLATPPPVAWLPSLHF